MTTRRYLTRRTRTRIFDAAESICCICKCYIHAERGEKWIVEHIKPLWLGGEDEDSNMAPAHMRCAIEKTSAEATVKAKNDRVRAKHLGIKKSGRTIPGRKFDGTPIFSRARQ
jgi:hypothetical protein